MSIKKGEIARWAERHFSPPNAQALLADGDAAAGLALPHSEEDKAITLSLTCFNA